MSKDISKPEQLITEHIDIWTSAILAKSNSGRGSSKKYELYGIKKLRELILELAVRGKLVPQDTNDEPASILLERVAAEKSELILKSKIKKAKALPDISDDEILYDLPQGWSYCRLGDITEIVRGITFPGSEKSKHPEPGRIACLRTSNVQDEIEWEDILYIRPEFVKRDDQYLCDSDIVMSMANSRELVGKVAKVKTSPKMKTSFGGFLSVIRPYHILSDYLMVVLRSPTSRESIIGTASQTTNIANISLAKLNPFILGVPPLAEQHRIVAKVDELMLLCDQLEQQTEDSIEAHATLVEVLLATLTDSADADELAKSWARISEHFDSLFTTEQSIEALKQTVLQLAVMGKLVPQNPNDEPASVLLEKIAEEKERLIKEGDIKKTKPLPELTDDEKPFESPTGWDFYRLGNLIKKLGSGSTPRGGQNAYVSEGIPFLRSQNVWNEGLNNDDIAYITSETHQRMSNTVVYPGDILLNITGASLGRSIVFPDTYLEANVSQHVTIIRLIDHSMTPFIYLCIRSPLLQKIVWERQVGMAIEGLSKKVLELFEIPIPPLAEQHRIIAKVDELMTICDQLKVKLQQSQETQVQLTDALVNRALG